MNVTRLGRERGFQLWEKPQEARTELVRRELGNPTLLPLRRPRAASHPRRPRRRPLPAHSPPAASASRALLGFTLVFLVETLGQLRDRPGEQPAAHRLLGAVEQLYEALRGHLCAVRRARERALTCVSEA